MKEKVYVLQFTGDVHSRADSVKFLAFDSDKDAEDHITANTFAKGGKFKVFIRFANGMSVDIPDVTVDSQGKITVY